MFSQSQRRRFAPARPSRWRQSRLLLEQLESRLNFSAVGDDFRISHFGPDGDPAFVADAPAVAYNSTDDEYLVVWAGNSSSGSEIYGQLLSAVTRRPLGESFQIASASSSDRNPAPAVAYNSTWNEYLVVWEGRISVGFGSAREIVGERLNASGEIVAEFQISNTAGASPRTPAVAYNSANNQYLVVWEGQYNFQRVHPALPPHAWESEIFGQLLGPAGIELRDNDFRISIMHPDGSFDFEANDPAVVYNSTDNDYLVAWSADQDSGLLVDDEFEIYGQRFDARPETFGKIGFSGFRISNIGTNSDPTFDALHPALTYNSSNNEYLVVWDGNNGSDAESAFEIYGQRLNGDTGLATGVNDFRISDVGEVSDGNFDARSPAVDYNRATNRYVVVWSGDDDIVPLVNDELEIFGQTLDANPASFGEIGPNDFRISSMGPNGDTAFAALTPALASSHTEFLAVWSGDDNRAPPVNDEFEIFGSLAGSTDRPEAFYDPTTRELLLYGSSQADAFGLSADVQGNIVITSAGKTVVPIDSASGQTQSPSLSNTQSIKSFLRDGEDRFDFVGDGFQAIAVGVIGEEGNDSLTFHSPDKPVQGEQFASFLFNGGNGSDTFQLITTDLSEEISLMSELEQFDIPCDALRVRERATDAIFAEVMAEDAENVVVDTGKGADIVEATAEWGGTLVPSDSPQKNLGFLFNLGDDDDTLEFNISSERPDIGLDLQVNGGAGDEAIEAALGWVSASDYLSPRPVNATFVLGDGLNRLQLDLKAEAGVGLNLQVEGGKDDDAIEAAVNWTGAPMRGTCRLAPHSQWALAPTRFSSISARKPAIPT